MRKLLLASLAVVAIQLSGHAATTINSANNFSYGANIGWMDWRADKCFVMIALT